MRSGTGRSMAGDSSPYQQYERSYRLIAVSEPTVSDPTVPDIRAPIAGVFVARPSVIGEVRGRPVESAIAKRPVTAPTLTLSTTNLAGDQQADLTVHGGPDKAVYAYPAAHYPAWRGDGFAVDVGGFGENVTLDGVDEHDVLLGDVWRWGDALVAGQPAAGALLQAGPARGTQGRRPADDRHRPVRLVPPACCARARCRPPAPVALVDRPIGGPTLADTFAAIFGSAGVPVDPDVVDRVLASPALADGGAALAWPGASARRERRDPTVGSPGATAPGRRCCAAPADIASIEGLSGLSIGRLASDLSISKAGVFAHFGSKEELQLATIRAAVDRFTAEVVAPAQEAPDGLARLVALVDCLLDYNRRCVFPGGCFFAGTSSEFHARAGPRPRRARRRPPSVAGEVRGPGRHRRRPGRARGPPATVERLAFEIDALGTAATLHSQLCDDAASFARSPAPPWSPASGPTPPARTRHSMPTRAPICPTDVRPGGRPHGPARPRPAGAGRHRRPRGGRRARRSRPAHALRRVGRRAPCSNHVLGNNDLYAEAVAPGRRSTGRRARDRVGDDPPDVFGTPVFFAEQQPYPADAPPDVRLVALLGRQP